MLGPSIPDRAELRQEAAVGLEGEPTFGSFSRRSPSARARTRELSATGPAASRGGSLFTLSEERSLAVDDKKEGEDAENRDAPENFRIPLHPKSFARRLSRRSGIERTDPPTQRYSYASVVRLSFALRSVFILPSGRDGPDGLATDFGAMGPSPMRMRRGARDGPKVLGTNCSKA